MRQETQGRAPTSDQPFSNGTTIMPCFWNRTSGLFYPVGNYTDSGEIEHYAKQSTVLSLEKYRDRKLNCTRRRLTYDIRSGEAQQEMNVYINILEECNLLFFISGKYARRKCAIRPDD